MSRPQRRRTRTQIRSDLDGCFAEYRRTEDRQLRNDIVEAHYGLAVRISREFNRRGEDREDLVQVALYGLVKAVERYDPDFGVAFVTYAGSTIRGELKHHFRDHMWRLHVDRTTKNLSVTLSKASLQLTQELGRTPRPAELAEHLGVSEDDIVLAIAARGVFRCESLDSLIDEVIPGDVASDDPAFDRLERRLVMAAILQALPARERRVVELRYIAGLKQHEIGAIVGLSQMQISRVLHQTLDGLRARSGPLELEEAV